MHAYRKFLQQIYQATKFVLRKIGDDFIPQREACKIGRESLLEPWILHKFTIAARDINFALTNKSTYKYWYDHLCNVFIASLLFLVVIVLISAGKLESHPPGRDMSSSSPSSTRGCFDSDPPIHAFSSLPPNF